MDRIRLRVDFNDMIDCDTVMLSQGDERTDFRGDVVFLYEGMPVCIYEKNVYEDGTEELLVAEGIVTEHDLKAYPFFSHVKWFCRIDPRGIQNRPGEDALWN